MRRAGSAQGDIQLHIPLMRDEELVEGVRHREALN
jgi:hypothetical protein